MSPTPPSTSSSTGARSPEEQFRVVRKRNRVPLSCHPCRTRKKCDRNHPCSNCTKREGMDTASCSYASPITPKKTQGQEDASPDDMRNRIDRLESLVLLLMHGGANTDNAPPPTSASAAAAAAAAEMSQTRSTPDSSSVTRMDLPDDDDDDDYDDDCQPEPFEDEDDKAEDQLSASLGLLKVEPEGRGKTLYIGRGHWHTILADITEVKNWFANHKSELQTRYQDVKSNKPNLICDGPTLLFGAAPAAEVELRAELPPKSTIIKLCSRYFNSMDNAVGIIHGPSFFGQLKKHWEDPSRTSVMWLGMLYAMLCLAMLSYHQVGDEPPEWKGRCLELAAEYRLRTVQCLVKADFTTSADYTVETLILYIFGEHSSRWDADTGLWYIVAVTTRVAFRMGYHRDAKQFPFLTPFQAEMRRRSWALLRMIEIVFSHQVSLPSMIHEHNCDTQMPNNYLDEDFDPNTKELPPPRPLSEPTPISYLIAKAKLCYVLGNILQAMDRVDKAVQYEEIIQFDAQLRQAMAAIPPHLKMKPWGEETNDPVTLIVARYKIDVLYLRIMCLLHRRYMTRARQTPRYALSRASAIDAAMRALGHLARLHRESQPGGRLRSVSWFVRATAAKDFVLFAMLISLELHYDNRSRALAPPLPAPHEGNFLWSAGQRGAMIELLEGARRIWADMDDASIEAFKGAKIVEIMLKKIQEGDDPHDAAGGSSRDAHNPCGAHVAAKESATPPPLPAGMMIASTSSSSSASSIMGRPDPRAASGSALPSSTPPTSRPSDPYTQQQQQQQQQHGGPGFDPMDVRFVAAPPVNGFSDMDFAMPLAGDADFKMGAGGGGDPAQGQMSFLSGMTGFGTGTPGDLISNFDWGAFENYTQMTSWGADQEFYGTGDQSAPMQDMDAGMGAQWGAARDTR